MRIINVEILISTRFLFDSVFRFSCYRNNIADVVYKGLLSHYWSNMRKKKEQNLQFGPDAGSNSEGCFAGVRFDVGRSCTCLVSLSIFGWNLGFLEELVCSNAALGIHDFQFLETALEEALVVLLVRQVAPTEGHHVLLGNVVLFCTLRGYVGDKLHLHIHWL